MRLSELPGYWKREGEAQRLKRTRDGKIISLGDEMEVRLQSVTPEAGGWSSSPPKMPRPRPSERHRWRPPLSSPSAASKPSPPPCATVACFAYSSTEKTREPSRYKKPPYSKPWKSTKQRTAPSPKRPKATPHHQGMVALIRPADDRPSDAPTLRQRPPRLGRHHRPTQPRRPHARRPRLRLRRRHRPQKAYRPPSHRRRYAPPPAPSPPLPLLRVTNLARTLRALQSSDTAIIGIDERGETDWSTDPPPRPQLLGTRRRRPRRTTADP